MEITFFACIANSPFVSARMDIDWSAKSWISNQTYIKASTAAFIKRPSASSLSQFYPMHDSLLVMDQMPPLDEDKYTLNKLTGGARGQPQGSRRKCAKWAKETR